MDTPSGLFRFTPWLLCAFLALPAQARQDSWPDLSSPPKAVGGGENDAAVIVAAEKYLVVDGVPGAKQNALDWQAYLTETLKVPAYHVGLLLNDHATLENMRKYAKRAAAEVKPGGTLWFVFIGHGAPSQDGKDGLLVGVDAQQDMDSIQARSLPRGALLGLLAKGKQAKTIVVLDACFSGKSSSGQQLVAGLQPLVAVYSQPAGLDARTILMTAAKSDEFAGPLPGSARPRPAFSYLILGALRGWANDAGKVTAQAAVDYARHVLELAQGRTQTPELDAAKPDAILGFGRESGPDLGQIEREASSEQAASSSPSSRISADALPDVPQGAAPQTLDTPATNRTAGQEYASRVAERAGAVVEPSGLVYVPIRQGSGESPGPADTVKVNYEGKLINGAVFDSSYARGQAAEFPLNGVIPCWTEGVQKMRVGGEARLICPSALAYGDQGRPPVIPPGATLDFRVELLSVVKQ